MYPESERSFRQTINAISYSDRGFKVNVDREDERVFISFDFSKIDDRHAEWRDSVKRGVGTQDIAPNLFWTFQDISSKFKQEMEQPYVCEGGFQKDRWRRIF